MKKFFTVAAMAMVFVAVSCNRSDEKSYWADDSHWYQPINPIDTNYVDVFYITSTEVADEHDSLGNRLDIALLTPEEVGYYAEENTHINKYMFNDSINFFAPYYHQATMHALVKTSKQYSDSVMVIVGKELCEAFDYYMAHKNGGRRFILAGFSQGAYAVKILLKHLNDEQYSRLVAAYVMGWGVNAKDLQCKYIVPATSASDTGVTVCYNTVTDTTNIWHYVQDSSVLCMNPINWTTTSAVADFEYEGQKITASVDTVKKVVVVKGFKETAVLPFETPWPDGNLHHYEVLFYDKSVGANARHRAYQ